MSGDLLSIARSGANAARAALDVTAQNIANASTEGYVRRSVSVEDVTATSLTARQSDPTLSGVRVVGTIRNADAMRSAEVRRTGADAARAGAEVEAYSNVEDAIEETGVFSSITALQSGLQQLAAAPTDPAQRAVMLQDAQNMAQSFNSAATQLASVGNDLAQQATSGVSQINTISGQLTKLNQQLVRTSANGSDQSGLLDQRDALLQQLSGLTDVTATIARNGSVGVQLGGAGGPSLVSGTTATPFALTSAANGTISFDVGGTSVALSGGSLAGNQLGLAKVDAVRTSLDAVANSLISTANAAQASGADLTGTSGQPMFSGTGAAGIIVALQSPGGIATAPAGAAANSRNSANIDALNIALTAAGPDGAMDALLNGISNTVAGAKTNQTTLQTIADLAKATAQQGSAVSLDQEAVNLVQFQQAYQASGRVMQVAQDIFSTLLAIH
jgi:flagellar hook-associated protein 1 FlgK